MKISKGTVPTENAPSYMRKLGQHWSHRYAVVFDENSRCEIKLPRAGCVLVAYADRLEVQLTIDEGEEQERLENVVEEHVRRFAFREPLEFVWERTSTMNV